MHTIQPASLKEGAEAIPHSDEPSKTGGRQPVVEGRALILWDPKRPGEKLDAIDTDQITPAADCVSESLEALDERWKAGTFRYLVPDFRKRVHSGETFVIAGAPVCGSTAASSLPAISSASA